jgi:hypothetical protein
MDDDKEDNPFGVAPVSTSVCPKCVRGNIVHRTLVHPCPDDIRGQKNWCSKAVCKECRHEWYVCCMCPNIVKSLTQNRSFRHIATNSIVKNILEQRRQQWKQALPPTKTKESKCSQKYDDWTYSSTNINSEFTIMCTMPLVRPCEIK